MGCRGGFFSPAPARAQVAGPAPISWRRVPAVAAAAWAGATAPVFLFELSYERGGLLRP